MGEIRSSNDRLVWSFWICWKPAQLFPKAPAPWDPSKKMPLAMAFSIVKVSSRFEKMAPQLCPFEFVLEKKVQKRGVGFSGFRCLWFLAKPQLVRFRRFRFGFRFPVRFAAFLHYPTIITEHTRCLSFLVGKPQPTTTIKPVKKNISQRDPN